ncbi:hypothetical protein ACTFIV_002026 [Dictyostelium citrinum]
MSTRVQKSAILNENIDKVWNVLRNFDFPSKIFPVIESSVIEGDSTPTTVGAIRVLKWKTGETNKQRLLELSDLSHKIIYELIESEQTAEVTAYISTIKLIRITESNQTLLTWESEFSADVKKDLINFESKSVSLNLQDLQKFFSK